MGKRSGFNRKGKLDSLTAPATKKKFTAPTLGFKEVCFTWGTVSDAARYAKVVDKLKEYVAGHFWNQATMTARAMEDLKALSVVKTERPVRKYWSNEDQTLEINNKRNAGSTMATVHKTEDWEHKLVFDKYLETYKTYKDGTKAWAENKGKGYYLVLQHCPPDLKTDIKNSAC